MLKKSCEHGFLSSGILSAFIPLGFSLDTDKWLNFRSKCIWISTIENTFDTSYEKCVKNIGCELLAVRSAYEFQFIQRNLEKVNEEMKIFVGLQRNSSISDKPFTWQDGTRPLDELWGTGYTELVDAKQCGVIGYMTEKRHWRLQGAECTLTAYSACEKQATVLKGNTVDSFRSTLSSKHTVTSIDKYGLCPSHKGTEPSKITCLARCLTSTCHVCAYDRSTKVCEIFVIRTKSCTMMDYNSGSDYFTSDYGEEYSCN